MSQYEVNTEGLYTLAQALNTGADRIDARIGDSARRALNRLQYQRGGEIIPTKQRLGRTIRSMEELRDDLRSLAGALQMVATECEKTDANVQHIFVKEQVSLQTILEKLGDGLSGFGGVVGNDGMEFGGTIVKYIDSVIDTICPGDADAIEQVTNLLSQVKNAGKVESKLYKVLEKNLVKKVTLENPQTYGDVFAFTDKWSDMMGSVEVVGASASTLAELILMIDMLGNKEKTIYEKIGQGAKVGGEIGGLSGALYKQRNISKFKEFIGDEYVPVDKTKLSNVGTAMNVVSIVARTLESGVLRFGECFADGEIDGADLGRIGISTSLGGLAEVLSISTCGLSRLFGIDVESMRYGVEEVWAPAALEYIRRNENLNNYISDESNPALIRWLASVGSATISGGELIADKAKNLWEGAKDGWNDAMGYISSLFQDSGGTSW